MRKKNNIIIGVLLVVMLLLLGIIYYSFKGKENETIGVWLMVGVLLVLVIPICILEEKNKKLVKEELLKECEEVIEKVKKLVSERKDLTDAYSVMYSLINNESLDILEIMNRFELELEYDYDEEEDYIEVGITGEINGYNIYTCINSGNELLLSSDKLTEEMTNLTEDELVDISTWRYNDIIELIIKDLNYCSEE